MIRQLAHVCFYTGDLPAIVEFYSGTLKFPIHFTPWFKSLAQSTDRDEAAMLIVLMRTKAAEGNPEQRTILANTLDRVLAPTGHCTIEFSDHVPVGQIAWVCH